MNVKLKNFFQKKLTIEIFSITAIATATATFFL